MRVHGIATCCLAFVALAATSGGTVQPTLLTRSTGYGLGVGQDATTVAWCADARLTMRTWSSGRERSVPAICPAVADVAVAGRRVAYAGYQEVRCVDTYSEVYSVVANRGKRVATLREGCISEGAAYRGLVSDGSAPIYAFVRSTVDSEDCVGGGGAVCTYTVVGGGAFRIVDVTSIRIPDVRSSAVIAAGQGLVATALAQQTTRWSGTGPLVFPRGDADGTIEIRRSTSGALVTAVQAGGVVRALAVTARRLVAVVRRAGQSYVAWYDARTGDARGEIAASVALDDWRRPLAVAGDRAVFVDGVWPRMSSIWLLDLRTGRRRLLLRRANPVYDLSLVGRRLVWAEAARGHSDAFVLEPVP